MLCSIACAGIGQGCSKFVLKNATMQPKLQYLPVEHEMLTAAQCQCSRSRPLRHTNAASLAQVTHTCPITPSEATKHLNLHGL